MKKLLFITHEASRTGAPFVILFFLQWLQKHYPKFEVSVLTLKDGELEPELKEACAHYYSLSQYQEKTNNTIVNKIANKLGLLKPLKNQSALVRLLVTEKFDVVYANTIPTMSIANNISVQCEKTKLIVHVHELSAIMKILSPNFSSYESKVAHFIAASDLVKNNLVNNWSIPISKVTRVYECAKINPVSDNVTPNNKEFCVGGSGTVHWRKGSDLFIQVARSINENYPGHKFKFIWVGGISEFEKVIIEEDLKKLGLDSIVSFVGLQKEPQKFYNQFDVFLMTSREDPFPLVCIEMGMLAKPIICFKGATGSEEIIVKGGGMCVPYLSIEKMADQVMYYKNHPEVLKVHGEINKIEFSKFAPELICPELFQVINKHI